MCQEIPRRSTTTCDTTPIRSSRCCPRHKPELTPSPSNPLLETHLHPQDSQRPGRTPGGLTDANSAAQQAWPGASGELLTTLHLATRKIIEPELVGGGSLGSAQRRPTAARELSTTHHPPTHTHPRRHTPHNHIGPLDRTQADARSADCPSRPLFAVYTSVGSLFCPVVSRPVTPQAVVCLGLPLPLDSAVSPPACLNPAGSSLVLGARASNWGARRSG